MLLELIDQLLHVLWGTGIVLVAYHFGMRSLTGCLLLPVLAILPRELVDQWNGWPIGDGKLMDIFFFGVGGLAGFITTHTKGE